jgi:uncharacterized protein (DUF362 family)
MRSAKVRGAFLVCPKTGRIVGFKSASRLLRWFFPIGGFVALLWYLVRVIPKPSRATYPCQRIVAPIAWGFIGYVLSVFAAIAAFRKARRYVWQSRYVLGAVCGLLAIVVALIGQKSASENARAFTPSDPPNTPMGTARGINPGRVVWVYAPEATPWNGTSGYWWDDNGTSQSVVDQMQSRSLRELTGATSDAAAWEALFRHFNQTHGKGDVGYQSGERIAIKINCNNTTSYSDSDNQLDASPHMVLALLRQLVNQAGVPQNLITVYEAPNTSPTRIIADRVFNKGHGEFPNVIFADCVGSSGRTLITWTNNVITYSVSNGCGRNIPTCLLQAAYVINMSLFKGHNTAGVTLTAKNHYGSINAREHTFINASSQPMGTYNPFVDLIGHKDLGGKTMLFLIDALYGANDVNNPPSRFQLAPFNNRWSSSLFASQDPVATDSVGLDFLNSEFGSQGFMNKSDNYLHEAALANSPPSGTFYKPNGDGVRLSSLGVHEHWNDAGHRQYTRNLGTGSGIELVPVTIPPTNFLLDGIADNAGWEIANNNGMKIWAAVRGSNLYVATWSPGTNGPNDHFIIVTDQLLPTASQAAFPAWHKAGMNAVSTNKPFLGGESSNSYVGWQQTAATCKAAKFATNVGQMEGTINLVEAFGYMPQVLYLEASPYATADGGALIASSQVPGGNGNGNIESNEFLAVPLSAIRDENLDGVFDILDPTRDFVGRVSPVVSNSVIAWPCVPAHSYQVMFTDDLTQQFQPLSTSLVATQGQFSMTYTDVTATSSAQRFYRVKAT